MIYRYKKRKKINFQKILLKLHEYEQNGGYVNDANYMIINEVQAENYIYYKLKEGNKYLVAVSQSDSENTILELYSKNNVSTIDNITEGIGKVTLVNLIKNQNIVGNYGTSKNAKELIAYDNN